MSLTIDTATLHKWALDNGYVKLSAITEFVRHQSEPNSEQVVEVFTSRKAVEVAHAAIDTAIAVLDDRVDDLFPEITLEEIAAALRGVMGRHESDDERGKAGKDFLARFGAGKASDLPRDKYREFLAAAAEEMAK